MPSSNPSSVDDGEAGGPPVGGASPSLSLINNSNGLAKNRSAIAKKAECLHVNLDGLIKRVGVERVGLVTLTFPRPVTERVEASRHFNSLATGVLRPQRLEFITVPERQGNRRFHFHLAAAFPWDIRSCFDFAAATHAATVKRQHYGLEGNTWAWDDVVNEREYQRASRAYSQSANERLRQWWHYFRPVAERYGFGRCETLPILSNAAALARYVGAYVTIASGAREPGDAGMRTVRYSFARVPVICDGVESKASLRTATVKFAWIVGGVEWRRGLQLLGTIFELDMDGLSQLFGKKYQYQMRRIIFALGSNFEQALPLCSQVPQWADQSSRVRFLTTLLHSLRDDVALEIQNIFPEIPF